MIDAITQVRAVIKVLQRNGCSDSQIVGILLDVGTSDDDGSTGTDHD